MKIKAVTHGYIDSSVRSAIERSQELLRKGDEPLWQAVQSLEEAAVRAVKTNAIADFSSMSAAVKTCETFSRAASKLARAHYEACEAIQKLANSAVSTMPTTFDDDR